MADITGGNGRVVNLFMVYSPIHSLAAENIVDHFEQGAKNCVFLLKPGFDRYLSAEKWDSIQPLLWPRFHPLPGLFGGTRRLLANLDILQAACADCSVIRLHTPVIDTEAVNYAIHFLKRTFSSAQFSVRLLPDGLLNIERNPLGPFREACQYLKKFRRLFSPSLNYYIFKGDRTGADDGIVDRIYVLPNFPHEYDENKIVEIYPFVKSEPVSDGEDTAPKALVLGQPMVGCDLMSLETMKRVSKGIEEFIVSSGISWADYKAHPRDKRLEFLEDGYHRISIDIPLEVYLMDHPYDLVIGNSSTALATARYILPSSRRVVAYGLEQVNFKGRRTRELTEMLFKRIGVEMVPLRETLEKDRVNL